MIAALYVEKGGVYYGLPDVEPWGLPDRDAREYAGPHPVVAHPPCGRWSVLAPSVEARWGHKVGDDGGTFAAALAAVRRFGGVLEHPAYTFAWAAHGLPDPPRRGWQGTTCGGFVCHVSQRQYGHRARKGTWLYAFGVSPETLRWGRGEPSKVWISVDRPTAEAKASHVFVENMGKEERRATPLPFRDLLLSIARSVKRHAKLDTGDAPR